VIKDRSLMIATQWFQCG